MNSNDKLFLQAIQRVSQNNREHPDSQNSLTVVKSTLSDELLKLFEVESNTAGAWFFNVYVEFTPLYSEKPAKEWMTA